MLLLFLAVAMVINSCSADTEAEIQRLLVSGDKLLLQGRASYQEAIAKYTQAVNLDHKNVKSLYRRAELYSMMKNFDSCHEDLNTLLLLDPLHRQGLTLRAKLAAQTGDLRTAAQDHTLLSTIWAEQSNHKKSTEEKLIAGQMHVLAEEWAAVQSRLKNKQLSSQERKQTAENCVDVLQQVVSLYSKDSVVMRLRRAECAIVCKRQVAVSEELKYVLKKEPQNLAAILLSARAFRNLGALEQAKTDLRRCLSLDPEYDPCIAMHKHLKVYGKKTSDVGAAMQEKRWDDGLKGIDDCFTLEEDPQNLDQLWKWRCEAYVGKRDVDQGVRACTTYLDLEDSDGNQNTIDVFLLRAELHIIADDVTKAEEDIQKAAQRNQNHEKVREYQQKIQRLKQQGNRKDYYKILGVAKTSSSQDIRRAYRKMAKTHHPDHLRSKDITQEERERNDKLFRDVNEAKEMLLDEEKRRRYDSGEDVTKPPEQQGFHHGSSFHFGGGGFPGGGFPGGGNFQFHFG